MKVTLFEDGYKNTQGTVIEYRNFAEFAKIFREPRYDSKKDGDYFVRGMLWDGKRKDEHLRTLELLIIDGDSSVDSSGKILDGAPPAAKVHEVLNVMNINHFIYSSFSHGKIVNGVKANKWRCVIPIELDDACEWPQIDFRRTLKSNVSRIIGFLQKHKVNLAPVRENNVLSQPWYFPRFEFDKETCLKNGIRYEYYTHFDGDNLIADTEPLNPVEVAGEEVAGHENFERRIMDLWDIVYEGNTFHIEIRDLIYGKVRDGLPKATVIADMIAGLRSSKAKDPNHVNHHKWVREMDSIEAQVDEAIAKFRPKATYETVELWDNLNRFTKHKLPPGFVGELAGEILETMTFPNQEIAIVAARHILCSISGRKCSVGSTKLDFSNVLVAEQATGKNTPNYCLSLVLDQVRPYLKTQYIKEHCYKFKGSKGSFGIKGLYTDMSRSPSVSVIIPEAGERSKSKAGDVGSLKSFTMQMQSIPAHIAIDVPTYSEPLKELFGVVTSKIEESNLESYKAEFTSASVESGELARKLIHFAPYTPSYYSEYRNTRTQFSEPTLIKIANIIHMAMDGEDYEYRPDDTKPLMGPCYKPLDYSKRILFEFEPDAEALLNADHKLEHEYRMQAVPKDRPLEWALMGRRKQKIMREALLYAISDWAAVSGYEKNYERIIRKHHYLAASAYVDECSRGLLANADLFVADLSNLIEELLRVIGRHMNAETKGSEMYKKTHSAVDFENGLISHNFLLSGNSPFRYALNKYITIKNAPMDIAQLCKKVYAEGEDLGYWAVLDTHPAKREIRSALGIKNGKKYLKVTALVIVKATENIYKAGEFL